LAFFYLALFLFILCHIYACPLSSNSSPPPGTSCACDSSPGRSISIFLYDAALCPLSYPLPERPVPCHDSWPLSIVFRIPTPQWSSSQVRNLWNALRRKAPLLFYRQQSEKLHESDTSPLPSPFAWYFTVVWPFAPKVQSGLTIPLYCCVPRHVHVVCCGVCMVQRPFRSPSP